MTKRNPDTGSLDEMAMRQIKERAAQRQLENAAPDLLAALKAMTDYMAYAEALGEDKAVFKNARAAIAKAEALT